MSTEMDWAAKWPGTPGYYAQDVVTVPKDDHGVSAASAHHDGSVFSSVGCAKSWLVDNTATKR